MSDAVTKEIGGDTYRCTKLPIKQQQKALLWLMQKLGPAAMAGLGGDGGADVMRSLAVVVANCTPSDLDYLHDVFLPTVELVKDGVSVALSKVYALHFSGKLMDSLKVYGFALEVNFADFLGAVGGEIQSALGSLSATGKAIASV